MLQMKQARMKGSEKGDGDASNEVSRENLQLYLWRSGRVSQASASCERPDPPL
jgi:hypothetical protein